MQLQDCQMVEIRRRNKGLEGFYNYDGTDKITENESRSFASLLSEWLHIIIL